MHHFQQPSTVDGCTLSCIVYISFHLSLLYGTRFVVLDHDVTQTHPHVHVRVPLGYASGCRTAANTTTNLFYISREIHY